MDAAARKSRSLAGVSMKTAVRRILLMSALMSPGALYALGLGEITLNSALNQPFDAEIELISATQEDLGALRAALASGDTFARYGLDRPAYLSDFTFQVARDESGRDVLRVTSPRPVTEPFVTLLVEANWPRGRLLREYTVLLDPPVYAPAAASSAPAVAAPRVSSGGATSARTAEPPPPVQAAPAAAAAATATTAPRAAPAPRATPAIEPGGTYRVRPNDTLWNIASAANPGTRSDVNRAMVAIFEQNPQAFDGNINVLRSGSTLRIPEQGQIQSISAAAAAAEVARQYDAWRNGTTAGAAPATSQDSARLRLVPPEQGTAAPSTSVTPPAAPATAAASPGVAPAAGAAADASIEDRINRLEAELAEAKRLLEVRNAELATLQGATPPAGEATAPAPGAAAEPATPVDPAATTPPEAAAPPAEAAPTAPAAPAPAAETAPPAEPQGPSLLERLRAYWWLPLALLAVALAAWLARRMRRERGQAEENLEAVLGQREVRTPGPTYVPRSREADILVEEKRPLDARPAVAAGAAAAATAAAPARKTGSLDETLSGDGAGNLESGDPLAEADFHMAYGLYDQAADLVQLAIRREPQRRELKLKLLEIFFVWGNRDRFLEVARDLDASRSDAPSGEWDKVMIMGKQIAPDDRLFGGTPRTTPESLDMELHSASATLDIDVGGTTLAGTPTDLDLTEKISRSDSSGLDFVFEDVAGTSSVAPTVETPRLAGSAASVAPTIETPRVQLEGAGDTQELTVDRLGLDLDAVRSLEALDTEDSLSMPRPVKVDDTVETPAPRGSDDRGLDDAGGTDLINSTALIRMAENTSLQEHLAGHEEVVVDLSDATGELPSLDFPLDDRQAKPAARGYDAFAEPPTQSEVGTKLDLARAYMDMGDPEGARSILDEVLHEGSPAQRQEAQRLIASLP
jgi:pilus assembly protein FimV